MTNRNYILAIPHAYSSVIFCKNVAIGLVLLCTTSWYSNIGIAGLIATIVALITLHLFNFENDNQEIHILNSTLVGLSLGLFFQLNLTLTIIIVFSSVLTVFFSIALSGLLWRLFRAPVLSLPFILISVLANSIARNNSNLHDFYSLTSFTEKIFDPWVDTFFSSLGATFFTPHPVAGIIIFICLLAYSRYLAFLAVCGYIIGFSTFVILTGNPQPEFIAWSGFNFILTAIALGGIYSIPGIASFGFAMLGACLAALLSVPVQKLLLLYGLPIMALPFAITTITLLIAVTSRTRQSALVLASEPGPPEINYERSRLARIRQGGNDSVPLLTPFYGTWNIYQGFNGKHTHQSPWQHALDFIIKEEGKSYTESGQHLEDYFCYGAPVISPVYGTVIRIIDNLPDNTPGEMDTKNNWGNLVLIRTENGLHVLLAHLSQNSIKVSEGEWIKPGTPVANCGNSGRSPQPHLHLQVQQHAQLGSSTIPFHLCSVIKSRPNNNSEYQVVANPIEDDIISPAEIDGKLAAPLHLPVGRTLHYKLEGTDIKTETEHQLRVDVSIKGQFRLVSDSGASVAFSEANGVIAFYDRSGPADKLLDMWTLCLGLTPLTERASVWKDSPSVNLLPLTKLQKLAVYLICPLGCGLHSHYERNWDEANNIWIQAATHSLNTTNIKLRASTSIKLDPHAGCIELHLVMGSKQWRAVLTETGLKEDIGIPGRSEKLTNNASLDTDTTSPQKNQIATRENFT